jgi:hypothetical protein
MSWLCAEESRLRTVIIADPWAELRPPELDLFENGATKLRRCYEKPLKDGIAINRTRAESSKMEVVQEASSERTFPAPILGLALSMIL